MLRISLKSRQLIKPDQNGRFLKCLNFIKFHVSFLVYLYTVISVLKFSMKNLQAYYRPVFSSNSHHSDSTVFQIFQSSWTTNSKIL